MKSNAVFIFDGQNRTLWTRSSTFPLAAMAEALVALEARYGCALHLARSFENSLGQEQFVEYLTDAARALTENAKAQFSTVRVFHANPPRFLSMLEPADQPLSPADFEEVARFTLPTDASVDELLDNVYERTQNVDSHWNIPKPRRSTSVGDVLVVSSDGDEHAYEVRSIGFGQVTFA